MQIENNIRQLIDDALASLDINGGIYVIEHPGEIEHGDYASNVALQSSKLALKKPDVLADLLIKNIEDNKYIEKMRREYDRRRKFIVARLNEIGLDTKMPYGAFYTFSNIKHLSKSSLKFSQNLLKKSKVAVVPGTEFGKFGEGYIRCSYATDMSKIKIALDRIEKFIH